MKARDYFDLVLKIILILLGILIIIWILQLLFGGSPGLEEFNFALILLLAGLLIQLYREVGVIKNDMKHNVYIDIRRPIYFLNYPSIN